jgi:LCP family protein required for cell wall assembly
MATTEKTNSSYFSGGTGWSRPFFLFVYLVIAGVLAVFIFRSVRSFVASWELTGLQGISIHNATATPSGTGEAPAAVPGSPIQSVEGPKPIPWDGASRVTVLVMGLDYRTWVSGQGPPLTDTMILLTVDPTQHTAGMLSIPRDLWVNIPGGYGYDRINVAYKLGEANKLPDGGPGLAMKTVEELLGVPIDYYAVIEFHAFEQFIDEIGGVKIDVPEKITIDPLGDNNTKTLKPGRQTLPGDLALAYVRARKGAGDDFGRSQRQQQVILAIRDRIISFDMLPTLVSRSGALYNELSSGVHTNLTLDQVIRLAWLGVQIPEGSIRRGAIAPPDMVKLETVSSAEGPKDVLKPITDKIRELRDEIFTDTGAIAPAPGMELLDRVKAEGAKVAVLNGTLTPNLASRTAEFLNSQGMKAEAGDSNSKTTYTEIYYFTGKPYTVKYLVDLMKIDKFHIHFREQPDSPVDVQVILGDVWASNNPMPPP